MASLLAKLRARFNKGEEKKKARTQAENARRLLRISISDPEEMMATLECSTLGLSPNRAKDILASHHPNTITTIKPPSWYYLLWKALIHPFNILLIILAVVSIATGDDTTFTILLAMVAVSVFIRWSQELKSVMDAESIKKMLKMTATVVRWDPDGASSPSSFRFPSPELVRFWNDHTQEILLADVVPGDIVKLSVGDIVPADCRLIALNNLMINQSALTGESMPVEKSVVHTDDPVTNVFVPPATDLHDSHSIAISSEILSDDKKSKKKMKTSEAAEQEATINRCMNRKNLCFLGTTVTAGSGFAVVVMTGQDSYMASNAELLMMERPPTAFDKGVRRVAFLLMIFMAVMVPLVVIINGLSNKDWVNAVFFGISIAVGLTPEMLPMIVNGNLARAAHKMSKHKCIVKRVQSLQNAGAMDILCTDKTGTLTEDHIVLTDCYDWEERPCAIIRKSAFLVSKLQTGFSNPMDEAIVHAYTTTSSDSELVLAKYSKVDEFPFDFVKRRMSIIVRDGPEVPAGAPTEDDKLYLICKGAADEVMALCNRYYENEAPVDEICALTSSELLPEGREKIVNSIRKMNAAGLRVLVVAYRRVSHEELKERERAENNLTFLGLMAFQDPPKDSAAVAIRRLRGRGVSIKVLTGDNHIVAEAVCDQVGLGESLENKASKRKLVVMTGNDLEDVHPDELYEVAKRVDVFARLTPGQKAQIVSVLKDNDHTVGFLGDGVNDALALKQADVGISVDTGSDLAKDAADIILLEKDLGVIGLMVEEGRRTHGNTTKYISMAASSNFGNVFSVLIAAAWLPFLPMTPEQLLAQNLLYDISQISIPWDKMDEEYLETPKKWSASNLWKFMVCIGPISSIFDITTFSFMWWHYNCTTPSDDQMFQSAWFTEGLVTQTLIVHMIRSPKLAFIESRASNPVIIVTSLIIAVAVAIPWTPIGTYLGMVSLPGLYYPYLIGANLSYCLLVNIGKSLYIKKFGVWLG